MDKLIIADRQTGKTRELIEKCHKDNYSIIVCPNDVMCKITFDMAKDLNMPIPMPITFREFASGKWCGTFIDKFYFDELQYSLQSMAKGVNIGTVVIDRTSIKEVAILSRSSKEIELCEVGECCELEILIEEFVKVIEREMPVDICDRYEAIDAIYQIAKAFNRRGCEVEDES